GRRGCRGGIVVRQPRCVRPGIGTTVKQPRCHEAARLLPEAIKSVIAEVQVQVRATRLPTGQRLALATLSGVTVCSPCGGAYNDPEWCVRQAAARHWRWNGIGCGVAEG
ncbi:hypothetical protein, partial [Xanthomonas phaseoli]